MKLLIRFDYRIVFALASACLFTAVGVEQAHAQQPATEHPVEDVQFANVAEPEGEALESIRRAFQARNEGYELDYLSGVDSRRARDRVQVLFVQSIDGVTNQDVTTVARVNTGNSTPSGDSGQQRQADREQDQIRESEIIVGDIILLLPGQRLRTRQPVGLLAFTVPELPEADLPTYIRPDWDPDITDVPGGCATEMDAYRRILLTWSEDVGNYIYHSINAHRVRMRDSFTHYHPVEGGFDEFYLVQMVEPGAKILISEKTDLVTNPDLVERGQVDGLIREYELEVGDIVYIPRGVIHRGVGGVVAQVITVPGFIPGSEWGVDHHLRAINERLNLSGSEALPYNEEASEEAVIR